MIDDKRDDGGKPAAEPAADSSDTARPQRSKLGLRKRADALADPGAAPNSPERAKTGLRSRFNSGGLKPPRRSGRAALAGTLPKPDREDGRGDTRPELPAGQPRVVEAEAGPVPATGVRLSKIMAERGLCSRREADQIIERGWVSVDGRRVSQLGIRIAPDAVVELAPEATARQAAQVTILLHKPVGYVSGQPEPEHVPAVTLIDAHSQFDRDVAQRFHPEHLRGLAPAGRLDIDSTGLLVLTQNGRIARQLIGDDSKVEKEYLVRVDGQLDERGLALLNHGLELDGRKLRPAKVEWINEDQLRFVLREGRKRQIRRMCELVGLNVVGLKRVRIGRVRLGDLPLGQWRFLRADERFS